MNKIKTFQQFNENTSDQDGAGQYVIRYGMNGGFNSETFELIDADNKAQAESIAYERACDEYSSYEGMHGLRTADEIMEEDEVDNEEAEMIYNEERDSWLEYSAEKYDTAKHDELLKNE